MLFVHNDSVSFSDKIVAIIAEKCLSVNQLLSIVRGHLILNVERLACGFSRNLGGVFWHRVRRASLCLLRLEHNFNILKI